MNKIKRPFYFYGFVGMSSLVHQAPNRGGIEIPLLPEGMSDLLFQDPEVVFSTSSAKKVSHLQRLFSILKKIVLVVLRILILPLGIWWLLERVCQYSVAPLSNSWLGKIWLGSLLKKGLLEESKGNFSLLGVTNIKRAPIRTKEGVVDSCLVTFSDDIPKRWVLVSCGNNQMMESFGCDRDRLILAKNLGAGVMFYNYPGVGKSSGEGSLEGFANAHSACLEFLEDVMAASEIICYGFSLGSVVQGRSLASYKRKDGVSYVFISDRGPKSLEEVAGNMVRCCKGLLKNLVSFLGWKGDLEGDIRLTDVPGIVVYPSDETGEPCDDGAFLARESLATSSYFREESAKTEDFSVYLMGVPFLSHTGFLCEKTLGCLSQEVQSLLEGRRPPRETFVKFF